MNSINLKQLLLLINDEKNLNADLCLDLDCKVITADIKPLIKAINYVINYLKALAAEPLHIGLSSEKDSFILVFLAVTDRHEIPPFDVKINELLKPFHTMAESSFESGKFAKILLKFPKP